MRESGQKPQENQIVGVEPSKDATKDEWQDWAYKLRDKANQLLVEEKGRIKQLRVLRKDVERKDKALGYYKHRVGELEKKVESYESSLFLRLLIRLKFLSKERPDNFKQQHEIKKSK